MYSAATLLLRLMPVWLRGLELVFYTLRCRQQSSVHGAHRCQLPVRYKDGYLFEERKKNLVLAEIDPHCCFYSKREAKKETELLEVARHLGPKKFLKRSKSICKSLTLKEENNLREKTGKEKSKQLMERIDETKPPNSRQRKQGEDLPPRLLGNFPFRAIGLKANVIELGKELEAREISFDRKITVTRKAKLLNNTNRVAWRGKFEVELRTRGYEWTGLKLPAKIQLLKQDMEDKEEHAGGEYDIDVLKYFKLVSTSIDKSIFED
jgi:hypothetical protein